MSKLHSQQRVILAIVSSGIATTLLKGRKTIYLWFKILLDVEADSRCGITKRSNLGNLFQCTKLIFWDKTLMQSKYNFEVINLLFQDICDTTADFDKKVVCFCNNFRQTWLLVS